MPKEVRKRRMSIKDGDFLHYLLTKNAFVKIKKFEFHVDKAIKQQIEKLRKQKLLLS